MSSKVTLTGRLTRDPELRFTNSGTAVAQFTVVTSKRFKNGDQWEEQDVSFWDCTAFKEQAENIAEEFSKGDAVIVVGQMRQESWMNKDNEKRTSWKVLVDSSGHDLRFKKSVTPATTTKADYDDPPF
jgi:single-strand DNA-binding protein